MHIIVFTTTTNSLIFLPLWHYKKSNGTIRCTIFMMKSAEIVVNNFNTGLWKLWWKNVLSRKKDKGKKNKWERSTFGSHTLIHTHTHCVRSPLKLSSLTTGCIIRTCLHITLAISLSYSWHQFSLLLLPSQSSLPASKTTWRNINMASPPPLLHLTFQIKSCPIQIPNPLAWQLSTGVWGSNESRNIDILTARTPQSYFRGTIRTWAAKKLQQVTLVLVPGSVRTKCLWFRCQNRCPLTWAWRQATSHKRKNAGGMQVCNLLNMQVLGMITPVRTLHCRSGGEWLHSNLWS